MTVTPVRHTSLVEFDHYAYSAEARAIRRAFGLTIAELADYFDIDARTINRWEAGGAAVPPGALERLRDLETTMNRRLIESIAHIKAAGIIEIPMYRDRAELEQHEPFYLDKPTALHEWEVAQLRERTGVAVTYTPTWRDAHEYRAPYDPTPSYLEGKIGSMRFRDATDVPPALRAALDGHLSPGFDTYVRDAIALIDGTTVDLFELAATIGADIDQPWVNGPSLTEVQDHCSQEAASGRQPQLIAYLVRGTHADDSPFIFELAGIRHTDNGANWIWRH